MRNTKLSAVLRASTEDHSTHSDEISVIEHQVEGLSYQVYRNITENPSPQDIVEDIQQADAAIAAVEVIEDLTKDPENTAALEAATVAWNVLCMTQGANPNVVSVESHALQDTVQRMYAASVESISKDAVKMSKRFDTSSKSIADAKGMLSKIAREVRSSAAALDGNPIQMNMEGFYSFMSRDHVPVANLLTALKEEERNVDILVDVLRQLSDEITRVSKEMQRLDPAKDGLTGCLRLIDSIQYDKIYAKAMSLSLLNSGETSIETEYPFDTPMFATRYYNNTDGSGLGAKGWLKVGGLGALSALLAVGLSTVTPAAGIIGGAGLGMITAASYITNKQSAQGKNTPLVTDAKELIECMESAARILDKAGDVRRRLNDSTIAIKAMSRVGETFAKYAKDNDKSWQDVTDTGLRIAATVATAVLADGKHSQNFMGGESVPPVLAEFRQKVEGCELAHYYMVDVVQTHVQIVGMGTLRFGSAVLHAVGKGKV